jgi:hypothetical protein
MMWNSWSKPWLATSLICLSCLWTGDARGDVEQFPGEKQSAAPQNQANDDLAALTSAVEKAQSAYEIARDEWERSGLNKSKHKAMTEARRVLASAEASLRQYEEQQFLQLKAEERQELEAISDSVSELRRDVNRINESLQLLNPGTGNGGAVGGAVGGAGLDPSGAIPNRRIHLLIFGTGNDALGDDGIVQGSIANVQFVKELFSKCCRERLRISPANSFLFDQAIIVKSIGALDVKPEDAVVCYISTHGAFVNGFHRMSPTGSRNASMDRAEIFRALQSKKAGLTVLVTDACGTAFGRAPSGQGEAAPRPPTWPLWHLLFKTRGEVNVNAAHFGREALFRIQPLGSDTRSHGGIFTREFVTYAVFGATPSAADITAGAAAWDAFFTGVGDNAYRQKLPVKVETDKGVSIIDFFQPRPCKLSPNGQESKRL